MLLVNRKLPFLHSYRKLYVPNITKSLIIPYRKCKRCREFCLKLQTLKKCVTCACHKKTHLLEKFVNIDQTIDKEM